MDGESCYQVKILSKQLNKRKFSTLLAQYPELNPEFRTRFIDGKGSFGITIFKDDRIKEKLVLAIKPSFQIFLNFKDINLLLQLKEFFGCGIIVNTRNKASFRVNSIQDLTNLRASIILGLSNLQKSKFPNYKSITRLVINSTKIPQLN